jgi:hypothetical protein
MVPFDMDNTVDSRWAPRKGDVVEFSYPPEPPDARIGWKLGRVVDIEGERVFKTRDIDNNRVLRLQRGQIRFPRKTDGLSK